MTKEDVLEEFGWDTEETYSELSGDLAEEIVFLRQQLLSPEPINQNAIDRYEFDKTQWIRQETLNSYENTMMLKPFLESVEQYQKDVYCNGKGGIASHNIGSSVNIQLINPTTGESFWGNVKWIEPSRLGGCGCWTGIIIVAELQD